MHDPHRLIDSQPQLDALCDNWPGDDTATIACDTEFVRTQTFWPQLCVIQIAVGNERVAIDLIADLDLSHLQQLLFDQGQTQIYHAAKQDLEAFYATYERLPGHIFDIQIGAGLLGQQPQIGYAGLVKEMLGIDVPKDQTRTDWSRRPLTDAQLNYALDDVAHLHELHALTRAQLESQGRLEWAIEDSQALLDPALYAAAPEDAWQRLGAIPYLPVDVQARARRLAAWREERARNIDRPRQWVLSDKALMQIAHDDVTSRRGLDRIDDLPPAVMRKQGAAIVDTVKAADAEAGSLELRQEPLPVPPDKRDVKRMSGIVRAHADMLGIAPEVLATRKDITGILTGKRDVRVLKGWRRAEIGERLAEAANASGQVPSAESRRP